MKAKTSPWAALTRPGFITGCETTELSRHERPGPSSPTFRVEGKGNSVEAALRDDLSIAFADELLRKLPARAAENPNVAPGISL